MPVTAKFIADFTNFDSQVQRAETKLTSFEKGLGRVDKDLEKLGNQFSGQRLIQQATLMEKAIRDIGGTAELTKSELEQVGNTMKAAVEKMQARGIKDIPENFKALATHAKSSNSELFSMQSILGKIGPALAATFSIGAITGFAKGIGEFAGKMADLSVETGIGTERLQAFNFQGAGVGLTIEDITGNMEMLARRAANGDDSAVGALEKLGVSADSFNRLSLDQKLFEISDRMEGIADPTERVTVLTDLFGRAGARMGRLMTENLDDVIRKIEESGAVIDDELIKKADEFDDAWSQAWIKFRAYTVETISFLASNNPLQQLIQDSKDGFRDFQDLVAGRGLAGATPTPGAGPKLPIGAALPGLKLPGAKVLEDIENQSKSLFAKAGEKIQDAAKKSAEAANNWARLVYDLEVEKALVLQNKFDAQMASGLKKSAGLGALMNIGGGGPLSNTSTIPLSAFNLLPPGGAGKNNVFPTGGGFNFSKFLGANLGPTLMSALTGGGSLTKSLGGLVGGGLTEKLFGGDSGLTKAIGGGLSKMLGKTIGGALSSALPGIGALAGPAIQGLGKLFGKMFGGESKETNRTRDSALAQFGTQDEFRKLATAAGVADVELRKVFSASKVKDFEAALKTVTAQMDRFAAEQEADAQRLTAAIEKYGFTFEQLGPAFQRKELDSQAKELIEDWRVLVGAGVDLNLVNEKMAGSINEYLQTALKVGAEIPNAFRPILQKMLEQGTLTDEAGNAITDLEAAGIHFSETMTEGFDRVVEKLDELIGKLQSAGTAMSNLPSVPTGPSADYGGYDPAMDLPTFARGTQGAYRNFGRGTLAVLHGRERVMTEGERDAGGSSAVVAAIQQLGAQISATNAAMADQVRAAVVIGRSRYA